MRESRATSHAGEREDHDLVVIGSGAAAFAAAITASEAGRGVLLLESGAIGGTCVNFGCVPSKAMLAPAELMQRAARNPFHGVAIGAGAARLPALVEAKDALVEELRRDRYLEVARHHGFAIRPGRAEFLDDRTVVCAGASLTARAFLVATGASPEAPPIPGLDQAGHLDSTSALNLRELPRELVVIGAGSVGLELGQLFLNLGSRVTILEARERIAPGEEPEAADSLRSILQEAGATVLTGISIRRIDRVGERRVVQLAEGGAERRLEADQVLVATGRRPNTAGLGLERAGVEVDGRGAVRVDAELRTTNPRVFAAGDATGHPQFVYVAAHEGALAAGNALLDRHDQLDLSALPRVVFTSPPLGAAGLTEAGAQELGMATRVSLLPLSALPRALVNRDPRGLFKLVAEAPTGRIVGATMVGDGAGEVIQAAVLAIRFGLTVDQIATTWAPYLTFAEAFRLAAQAFSRDLGQLSCCAA